MRWEIGEVLLGSGRSGISLKVGTAGAGFQDLAKITMEPFFRDCVGAYLILVIFFTQTKILDRKFYTEERVNYGKRISRQNSVNCDL